jgi:hypothetical protein
MGAVTKEGQLQYASRYKSLESASIADLQTGRRRSQINGRRHCHRGIGKITIWFCFIPWNAEAQTKFESAQTPNDTV